MLSDQNNDIQCVYTLGLAHTWLVHAGTHTLAAPHKASGHAKQYHGNLL